MPILTTHVGSLPRGEELAQLLLARDHGQKVDAGHFEQVVQAAIDHAVQKQVEAGVGVMSDGELGKVGYATYITERLEGFGGHVDRTPAKDLADFPALRKKLSAIMGSQEFVRAACIGPVKLRTLEPCLADIRRFKSAIERHGRGGRGFMNAASPGLVTAFQPNQHYSTHEAYLADLVEAMRPEYEAIVAAGFDLQLDCPDLAMAAHTGFQSLSEPEFIARAWQNVEALNAATRNIPSEKLRMHICWGNYEGPHHCDIALEKVIDPILAARPSSILFEAANPRHEHEWEIWRDAKLADDKILAPGLIDSCSNYVEHPELVRQRLERYVAFMGEDRVLASTDCGFGTFANYGKIDPAVTWMKLAALRDGAERLAHPPAR
ncbi:cobalamin-independent methionine synthase II family protein [Pusillimonas sp.]|uniref:cobalamin-independent methionine synthase II family protein n=1 Tax=Pusillimonas sp. TaxID=3040095 RepID=UPI0029A623EA|nr:cobalamin-independent methionine synthase II family protein [Pusillimonas sp.]MDX3894955.1 cobalamin-independent methionine synthase II family protein [Pusillimonas sp.]